MLKTRVITAIVGICIAIGAITYGGLLYNGLVALLTIVGWREFLVMMKRRKIELPYVWGYPAVIIVMGCLLAGAYTTALAAVVVLYLLLGVYYTFSARSNELTAIAYGCLGFTYTVSGMAALILLRDHTVYEVFRLSFIPTSPGVYYLWLLLLCTWASDTFAYFAGRLWGKRKIVPRISPNKTLEGFIGGFIGCICTGLLYAFIAGIAVHDGIAIGALVGVTAPLGDLFESKVKRDSGVKDSGVLLPGHGGVLDRFDSLLFAAPLTLVYLLV